METKFPTPPEGVMHMPDEPAPINKEDYFKKPKKFRFNKKILFILIIILISLTAVIFLAYQNQQLKNQITNQSTPLGSSEPLAETVAPDPTADWETYTNKNPNYLIRYPSEWFLVSSTSKTGSTFSPTVLANYDVNQPLELTQDFSGKIIITIDSEDDNTTTLENYLKDVQEVNGLKINKREEFNVGDVPTIRLEGATPINENQSMYYISVILINPSNSKSLIKIISTFQDISLKETFNQILSTFEFVE